MSKSEMARKSDFDISLLNYFEGNDSIDLILTQNDYDVLFRRGSKYDTKGVILQLSVILQISVLRYSKGALTQFKIKKLIQPRPLSLIFLEKTNQLFHEQANLDHKWVPMLTDILYKSK